MAPLTKWFEKQGSGGMNGEGGVYTTTDSSVFTPTFGSYGKLDDKKKQKKTTKDFFDILLRKQFPIASAMVPIQPQLYIQVGKTLFNVDLALTPTQQVCGLSNCEILHAGAGMLFVFIDGDTARMFNTVEMKFSIDIIAFDATDCIVHIAHNMVPGNIMISLPPCQKVLEINGGLAEKHNIKIGDFLEVLAIGRTQLSKALDSNENYCECDVGCGCVKENGCDCQHDCPCADIASVRDLPDNDVLFDFSI